VTHPTAISPLQAKIVQTALGIITSHERAERLRRLDNSLRLSSDLEARAFTIKGQLSPVVPVVLSETSAGRRMTKAALARGALVNPAEHPQVSRRNVRWPVLVMEDDTHAQIDRMVTIAAAARKKIAT